MSGIIQRKLSSGASLRINIASFTDGRALYQSILREMKILKISEDQDIDVNLLKDMFCILLSSEEIEKKILVCANKALYNDIKITEETFEPVEAREDYIECLYHVALENIRPFGKALIAEYKDVFDKITGGQKLKSQTTSS